MRTLFAKSILMASWTFMPDGETLTATLIVTVLPTGMKRGALQLGGTVKIAKNASGQAFAQSVDLSGEAKALATLTRAAGPVDFLALLTNRQDLDAVAQEIIKAQALTKSPGASFLLNCAK